MKKTIIVFLAILFYSYRKSGDNEIEILAKSGKKKSNQQFVINRLKEIYG